MSRWNKTGSLILALGLLLGACRKEKPEQQMVSYPRPVLQDYDYDSAVYPTYFSPPFGATSINHPITNAGAKLGRVLFYDKRLSATNTVSCGSCHHQDKAFSDPHAFSRGVQGHTTDRHSMAVFNTRFAFRYFWDLRSNGIENQVLQPIQNPKEMGMDLAELVEKLKRLDYYPSLFEEAFGSPEINTSRVAIALGMFVQSIASYQSKFDMGYASGHSNLSPLELDGMNLFNSGTFGCSNCHGMANFTINQAMNNGLDLVYTDTGLEGITGDASDIGKFKIPSLRNIALTAPYMHDGRFATLEQVIEHYNSGVQQHPNLDERLTVDGNTGGVPKQNFMSTYDKQALVAFLHTLTDYPMVNDPKWSDPFPHE